MDIFWSSGYLKSHPFVTMRMMSPVAAVLKLKDLALTSANGVSHSALSFELLTYVKCLIAESVCCRR